MKHPSIIILVALVLSMFGCSHDSERIRGGQNQRWRSPIIDVVDANHDGVIDSNELANASTALMQLDKNKDGKLSYEEIHWPKESDQVGEPEPVIRALDRNHDDIIDAQEISQAPLSLKKLDKNGDSQLAPNEYTPQSFIGSVNYEPPPKKFDSGPDPYHRNVRTPPLPAGAPAIPQPAQNP
jgi:hypothetical protein